MMYFFKKYYFYIDKMDRNGSNFCFISFILFKNILDIVIEVIIFI